MYTGPATLKEIADRLNIAVSTVSRALHDNPTIGRVTQDKVKRMAKELGYEPNQTAILFQKGRTNTIGVIVPELSEPFFSLAISAIEDEANKKDYTLLIAQSHNDPELEKRLIEKMRRQRVDGLLISLSKNTYTLEHFEQLQKQNIPVVYFDRIPAISNINYVSCDMESGTVHAVNYLLKKGHRVIGMINGPSALFASVQRKEGYIKAMNKNRLKFDPSLIVSCDLTEEGTINATEHLLANKRRPTAIVAFNDYIALFAIKHASSSTGCKNGNIEFVSFANLPFTRYLENAPAASVEQFPYLQGQKAADILLGILKSKADGSFEQNAYYKILIESELVEHKKTLL